jgi:hypothetical protein
MTKQGKLKKEKKQGKLAWTMPGDLEKVKDKKQCKLQKGDETRQGNQGKRRRRNKASRKRRRNKASSKMGRAAQRFKNNGSQFCLSIHYYYTQELEGLRDAVKERKWGSGQTADKGVDVGD